MKVIRNAAAVLGLLVAVVAMAAPAEARIGRTGYRLGAHAGHQGWSHRHVTAQRHAFGYRAGHRFGAYGARGLARGRVALRAPIRTAVQHAFRAAGGNASWYGPGFHGRRTASGEVFNSGALTAAHRSLPFGTMVRVTNQSNGRSVVVRINDRGPFVGGRQIDLAAGAARAIGMSGTSYVSMSVVH